MPEIEYLQAYILNFLQSDKKVDWDYKTIKKFNKITFIFSILLYLNSFDNTGKFSLRKMYCTYYLLII